MPDLCPKGIDLGVKPSAPSCPPTLPLYPGLQTEQTESQSTSQEGLPWSQQKPKLRFRADFYVPKQHHFKDMILYEDS